MARPVVEVVLVRHAQTAWSGRRYSGRSDLPLDRAGRAAAARVAADLRAWLPEDARIVSSPRRRAVETATAIASALGNAPIELDDRWAETDFGVAEGLGFEELTATAPEIAARLVAGDVEIDWPGGEAAATLAARIAGAWTDLVQGPAGTIVVVTHGGPIRVAVSLGTRKPAAALAVPPPGGTVRLVSDAPGEAWQVVEGP
jgi:broad specificity phosphatase PhoE